MGREDEISKTSVFEILGNLMSIPYEFDRPITEKDVSESMDEIRALPSVTPTQKWIPVSERLPEEGQEVLVYYEYFRYGDYNCMQTTYGVGYQYNGNWCGDVRGHKLKVIAWHPMPSPYKVENE